MPGENDSEASCWRGLWSFFRLTICPYSCSNVCPSPKILLIQKCCTSQLHILTMAERFTGLPFSPLLAFTISQQKASHLAAAPAINYRKYVVHVLCLCVAVVVERGGLTRGRTHVDLALRLPSVRRAKFSQTEAVVHQIRSSSRRHGWLVASS